MGQYCPSGELKDSNKDPTGQISGTYDQFKFQNIEEQKILKNQKDNSHSSSKTSASDNINELSTKYQNLQNELILVKGEREKLNKELSDKYANLESNFKKIEEENKQLKYNNEKYTQNIQESKKQIDQLGTENEKLSNNLQILEKNNKILENNNKEIILEKNNIMTQLTNNQNQLQNLNNELSSVKIKNQNLNEEIIKKNQEITKLNSDYQTKIQEISNSYKDYNLKIQEISLTKDNEILTLKQQLNLKTQEFNQFKNDYDKLIPITVGLDNIGATCYMNATIQSFSSVRELSLFFKEKYIPNKDKKMSKEYYTVIQNLWDIKKHGKSYAPNSFKEVLSQLNPMFAGVAANDSKDLINFLLEKLHEELNLGSNKNFNSKLISHADQKDETKMLGIFLKDMQERYKSIISDLFYGVIETKSQCLNCQNTKYNFQVFSFLEFPLQQVNDFCYKNGMRQNFAGNGNPDIDLYECFFHYQNISTMNGNNQIFCNDCGKNCDALYGTFLYSMPNYFIINLNRGKNAVYKCNVKFPEILKLNNLVRMWATNSIFQLKAVICHIGPSSMGGHFIAYCRHYKDNNWYKYNDSNVTKCMENKEYLINGMPYILFYEAIDKN